MRKLLSASFAWLLLTTAALGSLPSTQVWEVRTTGADDQGGGFDPNVASAGTDFSQQDSAAVTYTDLVIGATATQLTSAANPFTSAHVGNTIHVTGGTGFTTGWYSVRSVSGSTATMDRAVGTAASTGGAGKLGGALASPGQAAAVVTTSNTVWIKSGTYSIAGGTANTSGNRVATTAQNSAWRGYDTTRGDITATSGTRPVLQATAGSITMFNLGNNNIWAADLEFHGNGQTSLTAVGVAGNNSFVLRFLVSGVTGAAGINVSGSNARAVASRVTAGSHTGGAFSMTGQGASCYGCTADANAGSNGRGFQGTNAGYAVGCVASGNSGTGFEGVYLALNCTADGNGGTAFTNVTNALGCLGTNSTGYGFATITYADGCYGYGNSSGTLSGSVTIGATPTTLSVDPYANRVGGDFTPNALTGGGLAIRGAGWPQSYPGLSPTSYPTAGAYQPNPAGFLSYFGF